MFSRDQVSPWPLRTGGNSCETTTATNVGVQRRLGGGRRASSVTLVLGCSKSPSCIVVFEAVARIYSWSVLIYFGRSRALPSFNQTNHRRSLLRISGHAVPGCANADQTSKTVWDTLRVFQRVASFVSCQILPSLTPPDHQEQPSLRRRSQTMCDLHDSIWTTDVLNFR